MAEVHDKEWLKKSLAVALGWDVFVVEGVVEAINHAANRKEVDQIVQDYMGDNVRVQRLVGDFLAYRHRSSASVPSAAPAAAPAGPSVGPGSLQLPPRGGNLHFTDLRGVQGEAAPPEQAQAGEPGRAKRAPGKAKGKPGGANQLVAAAGGKLEKRTPNCLCCGRVFDARGDISPDVAEFLKSGGHCTFCGAKVALNAYETSETNATRVQLSAAAAAPAAAATSAAASTSETADPLVGSPAGPVSEADAAAVAFKDRLVGYDRDAAQRTAVIDDQSDYFEIDSNAWLGEEERRELKAQQRAVEEAEEARRKRITVTFDLLGRQVLLANHAEEEAVEQSSTAQDAAVAAAATAAEIPQGGGTSATAAMQAAEALAGLSLQPRRITRNPTLPGPAPIFVPQGSPAAGAPSAASSRAGSGSRAAEASAGTRASTSAGEEQQRADAAQSGTGTSSAGNDQARRTGDAGTRAGRGAGRSRKAQQARNTQRPSRLQHDDPFALVEVAV